MGQKSGPANARAGPTADPAGRRRACSCQPGGRVTPVAWKTQSTCLVTAMQVVMCLPFLFDRRLSEAIEIAQYVGPFDDEVLAGREIDQLLLQHQGKERVGEVSADDAAAGVVDRADFQDRLGAVQQVFDL